MVSSVTDRGWTVEATAERFQIDAKTAREWRDRSLVEGDEGFGIGSEQTLRNWVDKKKSRRSGERQPTSEELAEIKALRREVADQQWTGPVEDAWTVLDPQGEYEDSWNRAASFIAVVPAPGSLELKVVAPRQDIVAVYVDPCDSAIDALEVTHMIAPDPIDSICLTKIGNHGLDGIRQFVYTRSTYWG